jgi:hypothetical protein
MKHLCFRIAFSSPVQRLVSRWCRPSDPALACDSFSPNADACYLGPPVQGYLAHEKQPPPGTPQKDCASGPRVAMGRGDVSYERGALCVEHGHVSAAKLTNSYRKLIVPP